MNNTLNIDYTVVFYMVVGLFGLAGFLRGWWKEAITTGLLSLLLIMLEKPELAQQIIDSINKLIDTFRNSSAFSAAGNLAPGSEISASQRETYIIVLIVLIIVSYFIGNMTLNNNLTAGGRIFGAIFARRVGNRTRHSQRGERRHSSQRPRKFDAEHHQCAQSQHHRWVCHLDFYCGRDITPFVRHYQPRIHRTRKNYQTPTVGV